MRTSFDLWHLARYGVIRLRRCFAPRFIDAVQAAAQRIYVERVAAAAEIDALPAAERRARIRQMSTVRLDDLVIDGKPAAPGLASKRVLKIARAYLGREPSLEPNSYVRQLVPGPGIQALPFHQDQTILKAPLINTWIPLTPCGTTAPGLEVVVTSRRRLLDVSGDPADAIPVERARLDEDAVLAAYGTRSLWHPALKPGDALVFAGTTIHRSFVTPVMTKPRMSIELRFV